MGKINELKAKAKDFWACHKYDIETGVVCVGSALITGYCMNTMYKFGYNKGAGDMMAVCETYIPEANVTSTLTQLAMKTKK